MLVCEIVEVPFELYRAELWQTYLVLLQLKNEKKFVLFLAFMFPLYSPRNCHLSITFFFYKLSMTTRNRRTSNIPWGELDRHYQRVLIVKWRKKIESFCSRKKDVDDFVYHLCKNSKFTSHSNIFVESSIEKSIITNLKNSLQEVILQFEWVLLCI